MLWFGTVGTLDKRGSYRRLLLINWRTSRRLLLYKGFEEQSIFHRYTHPDIEVYLELPLAHDAYIGVVIVLRAALLAELHIFNK